ncbi:M43 family zinc metalloprotease [Aegicerativicinus sediminis]|uniref:M43 family zinc metalloprotease n=1 Tax=Aegicerativicinus sediminis TaxID=2893202 RepID=UPI001E5E7D83|nr:M43 family zinc metalloprotease [Aegicerativicinus sediminis]
MRTLTSVFVFLIYFVSVSIFGQEPAFNSQQGTRLCLTEEYNDWLQKKFPNTVTKEKHKEAVQFFSNTTSNLRSTLSPNTVIRIPIIVHVIHAGEAIGTGANISDAQVLSQIQVLNEDFRKMANTRGDNNNPVGADTEIEFYLAQEDPWCNPTTGIERIDLSSVTSSWSGPGGNTDTYLKPNTIWDPTSYLNIWTVKFSNVDNLGFSQYPGGNPETDGVVINYLNFGSDDDPNVTLEEPYHLGRTTTHEVGHFFGLYHIWEGKNCNGTNDGIDDTPPQSTETFGCPDPVPDSCPDDEFPDMIENYLDYTDDVCMNLFTEGQKAVMRGYLEDPNYRLSLANSTVSDTPLPIYSYDASIRIIELNEDVCNNTITPELFLGNYGSQPLTTASISYSINGIDTQVYNWSNNLTQNSTTTISLPSITSPQGNNVLEVSVSLNNSDPRTCNNSDNRAYVTQETYPSTSTINLELKTDSWAEETSWEFKDSSGTVLYSDGPYQKNSDDDKIFNYTFEVNQNECYVFSIYDTDGDGICCTYGDGYYQLSTGDNTLIFSGGEFEFVEATTISTAVLSTPDYFHNSNIKLFPNPTKNEIFIKVGNNELPDSYEVFDMLGQKIQSSQIESNNDLMIDALSFSSGLYFVKLKKGNAKQVFKFIKH